MNILLLIRAINSAAPADSAMTISAVNERIDGDGEWFRLAPPGEHPNEVGVQVLDADAARAMVAAFNSVRRKVLHPRGLPIWVGHPTDKRWRKDNPEIYARFPHPVGRIVGLEERSGEVWYKPAFNSAHLDLVKGDGALFEFQSPEWGMTPVPGRGSKVFRPVLLYGIGLTNTPQISGTTIGLNEVEQTQNQDNTMPTWLIEALGFKAGEQFTEADVQGRLTAALNERTTALTNVQRLTADLATMTTRATTAETNLTNATNERTTAETARAAERAARTEAVVTAAITAGRIKEADRATWVTALNEAKDFDAEAKKLGSLTPAINTAPLVRDLGNRRGEGNEAAKVIAINEAVTAYAKEHGLDLATSTGHHAAYVGAKAKNPALFGASAA